MARRSKRFPRTATLAFATASLAATVFALTAPGCSKTSTNATSDCADSAGGLTCSAGTCAKPGAPTPGPKDTHCGTTIQPVVQAACAWDGGGPDPGTTSTSTASSSSGSGGAGGGGAGSGGASAGGAGGDANSEYGPTQYGNESDDDDCKYHVQWSSTPICENAGVTFTVVATNKQTGMPVTDAEPFSEVYLSSTHASPNGPCACSTSTSTEGPPGTYTIGPVFFDEAGTWTVRFHFNHDCTDFSAESPHGHAAFFVDVP